LKLWPTVLIYGVHFESADDFRLTSLSIRYSDLDTWVATSGFTVKFDPALYPVEVRYAKPESVESQLSESLKISIKFSASGPSLPALTNVSITQRSWLTITSATDLPFKRLLEHITDFANLISLAVGEPLRPLEMASRAPTVQIQVR
jgi:ApeA N-terminal domain 1